MDTILEAILSIIEVCPIDDHLCCGITENVESTLDNLDDTVTE